MKFLLIVLFATFLNAELIQVNKSIIKDNKTNFLWQDTLDVKTTKRSFKDAVKYCDDLKINNEKNWKLPTFMALFSIVNTKVYNPTLSKEFNFFVSDNYWTSKKFGHAKSGEAFVINFLSGAFNRELMEDKFFVRCYKEVNKKAIKK